jgi:hypothetical protein
MEFLSGRHLAVFVRIGPGLPQIFEILSGLPDQGIFQRKIVRIGGSGRSRGWKMVQVSINDVASPTEQRKAYKEIIKCQLNDE